MVPLLPSAHLITAGDIGPPSRSPHGIGRATGGRSRNRRASQTTERRARRPREALLAMRSIRAGSRTIRCRGQDAGYASGPAPAPSRTSPRSSAPAPCHARRRGGTTAAGWWPRPAAAVTDSGQHQPASDRRRAGVDPAVVHRLTQRAMGAPVLRGQPQPGQRPVRTQHRIGPARTAHRHERSGRPGNPARNRDSTASGPTAAACSSKLPITASMMIIGPLARTQDHAKAALTRIDTAQTPVPCRKEPAGQSPADDITS